MENYSERKSIIDIGEKNTKRVFKGLNILDFMVMIAIPISLYFIDNFIIHIPNPFGGS